MSSRRGASEVRPPRPNHATRAAAFDGPRLAPRQVRTRSELRQLQRIMMGVLVRPLGRGDELAPRTHDGRSVARLVGSFIKPNDRLSSTDRLEIYARCYWYRIIDSLYEDCPGLRALLGERRFAALARAFLARHPSRSFTLRNLCQRLPRFLLEQPALSAPHTGLAHAIAQFEWAQTHAFDAAEHEPLAPADFAAVSPDSLRFSLQPHLTLLALDWPADDFVMQAKRRDAAKAETGNAARGAPQHSATRRLRPPPRERVFLAVHRHDNRVFHKRLPAWQYRLLTTLAKGSSLDVALASVADGVSASEVRDAFTTWAGLRWLCRFSELGSR